MSLRGETYKSSASATLSQTSISSKCVTLVLNLRWPGMLKDCGESPEISYFLGEVLEKQNYSEVLE